MGQLTYDQAAKPLSGPLAGLVWLFGGLMTLAAAAVGAVLTVVFAATLAVVAIMALALFGLFAVAARGRRRRAFARAADDGVIEARKVGHAWVAYGWDRQNS
jgi:hypothetical protein